MSRRNTTVYDLADLRLHPDGTRVHDGSKTQINASGRTKRNIGKTVQDFRGAWIAQDAGGPARVPKRPRLKKPRDAEDEDEAPETDKEIEEQMFRTKRAKRKHDFLNDLEFLVPAAPVDGLPSSVSVFACDKHLLTLLQDLLKIIHYQSSVYYTERGQLLNSSQIYRDSLKDDANVSEVARTCQSHAVGPS